MILYRSNDGGKDSDGDPFSELDEAELDDLEVLVNLRSTKNNELCRDNRRFSQPAWPLLELHSSNNQHVLS